MGKALRAFVWASFTSPNCRRTMKDTFKREIKYMRISLTELCNLRCRYCMPEVGVCKKGHDEMLTQEEILSAVKVAAKLGVNKIRLTGGEPLVKKDIVQLVSKIKSIDGINEICLTTNATLLPVYAKDLKKAGLDRINISLDTLDEKFSLEFLNTILPIIKPKIKIIEKIVKDLFLAKKFNSPFFFLILFFIFAIFILI